ncbi:hypothetical protein HJB88_12505 [Rhizobium sp. NZLR5]|uniref:hypothetical protein n=1 Tax=unclassified Rhizobium TaxID=2613769 RepID=UPI001C83D7BC|nr:MULTISPECIES: hypothetical protein [unclassified Rhizobium]MBX5183454.1 hypothetical protein [Rhizobium sp. NZLR5]MBX5198263.1 hypothetical protein [Rhizobium sp. NZLR10]
MKLLSNLVEVCRRLPQASDSFDAITIPGADEPAVPAPSNANQSKASVGLVSAKMRIQNKDYKRQIFSDRVELVPTFKNTSKKTVVAIAHTLSVTDAFGDKIVDGVSKLDTKIPPGRTVERETYYMWEDNQFIQGEPYDKFDPAMNRSPQVAAVNLLDL